MSVIHIPTNQIPGYEDAMPLICRHGIDGCFLQGPHKHFHVPPKLRKMPEQKPGRSKQDYRTPQVFIDAVYKKWVFFGFSFDLAADRTNRLAHWWFGPGASLQDSIAASWLLADLRDAWLNPPFGDILPFAKKCANHSLASNERIFFLTPASVGSNWFCKYVHQKARVYFLQGRLSFDGKAPYPKDCILSVYGETPGYEVWDWRKSVPR